MLDTVMRPTGTADWRRRTACSSVRRRSAQASVPARVAWCVLGGGCVDDDRFDGWAKTLAVGTPRRRVLKGLGSTLAGLLALGGVAAVEAGKKPSRKKRSQVRAQK